MQLRRLVDLLVYVIVRLVICAVQAAPMEVCRRGSGVLATLFASVLKIRRRVIEENLKHAYPRMSPAERKRIAWRMWEHLFLMVAEIAHARRKLHPSNWHRYITFVRDDRSLRALIDDRPLVMVSGHYGNFELSGYLLGMIGFPTYAIARPLDNPYLDRFISRFRGATGQHMLPKQGSAPQVEALLARGDTLGLLGDQAAGKRGCWINFFNRPASCHKAIALFSLGSGCPLMVSYSRRTGGPLIYEMGRAALADPAEPGYDLGSVPLVTQWYSDHLEQIINVAPEQYWWVHRRWKGEPPARRRQARAA